MKKLFSAIFVITLTLASSDFCFATERPSAYLSAPTASAGDTIEIALGISDCESFSNLAFEITYDCNKLTLTNVQNLLQSNAYFTQSQYNTSPFTVSWITDDKISYSGNLAVFTFKVDDNASGMEEIKLSYSKGVRGDYIDGVDVNFSYSICQDLTTEKTPLNLSYYSGGVLINSYLDLSNYVFYLVNYDVNGKMTAIRQMAASAIFNESQSRRAFMLRQESFIPVKFK